MSIHIIITYITWYTWCMPLQYGSRPLQRALILDAGICSPLRQAEEAETAWRVEGSSRAGFKVFRRPVRSRSRSRKGREKGRMLILGAQTLDRAALWRGWRLLRVP